MTKSRRRALSPEAQAKFDAFLLEKVDHERQRDVFERVWASISDARDDHAITAVVGGTGVGKTNLIERVEAEAREIFKTQGAPRGRLAFLRIDAAPPLHADFRFPGFYQSILQACDAPLATSTRSEVLQAKAIKELQNRSPIVFCVDEAQHMIYAAREIRLRRNFDTLKHIANQATVPIVLFGTYELFDFALLSGQLGRRFRHIPFLPYAPVAKDLGAFLGAVQALCDAMPVTCGFDVSAHCRFFFMGSCGSIGHLKPWFERVLRRCLLEGRSRAAIEDFKREVMMTGKLTKIAKENDEGLKELRLLEGDEKELQLALGYPDEAKEPTPIKTARTTKPGQRTLQRDPVGTARTEDKVA